MNVVVKRHAGIVAGVLVVAMLLTGTFAWSSNSQRAFNAAWYDVDPEDTNYGGRIRDDYDGDGPGEHNKDVYAENFGENPLFVRIRLREFLSINGEPVIPGMIIDDTTTWPIYLSQPNDVHTPRAGEDIAILHGDMPDGYGIRWDLGHRAPKYFMPTHNHATNRADIIDPAVPDLFAHEEAFRKTEATGRAVNAITADDRYDEFDPTDVDHARDFWENGRQTGPGDGSHNFWSAGDTHEADLIYTEENELGLTELRNAGPVTHTAQATLEPSIVRNDAGLPLDSQIQVILGIDSYADFVGVMTMSNWINLGRPAGNFWILDVDGWFYWNGWLPAGEATSLLLDAIYLPERGNDSWQHVIEVEGDFFTPASINGFDLTEEARSIFSAVADLPEVDAAIEEDE